MVTFAESLEYAIKKYWILCISVIITPYIRILDIDWLIAGVFSYLGSYLGLISFIFTAARVFA